MTTIDYIFFLNTMHKHTHAHHTHSYLPILDVEMCSICTSENMHGKTE